MANSVRVIPANDKSLMSSSQGYVIASFKTFVTYLMVFVYKWQALKHFLVVHNLKAHFRNLNFDIQLKDMHGW